MSPIEHHDNDSDPERTAKVTAALGRMRLKLLDLTARNRLLNFKASPGRALPLVHCSPLGICRTLLTNGGVLSVLPIPEPAPSHWLMVSGRLSRPEVRDAAELAGIDPALELGTVTRALGGGQVRALHYSDDLARHCRKLQREAKSALAETGANILYLVFGLLEFPEKNDSDTLLTAPLIVVPVTLDPWQVDPATGHEYFGLRYTGEDLEENLSLREKLRQEYNFDLPAFGEQSGPEAYWDTLARQIERKARWKVQRRVCIALLSFAKMLLERELNPARWPAEAGASILVEHDIVRKVFEGAPPAEDEGGDGLPYHALLHTIDGHALQNLPLIYDADSSQHSALIDVFAGKNLVIEGPPGTGKSQTITNLIAAAIAEGKTVLFVAEKMAALDVVKKRLTGAGLAPFCLELHSNKTHKKFVLSEIEQRLKAKFALPAGLAAQLELLEKKRCELAAYADLLNSVQGNVQDLTVHQVLWRAEKYRQASGDDWLPLQELMVPRAAEVSEEAFSLQRQELAHLVLQFEALGAFGPNHPFWGFDLDVLAPGADLLIERLLASYYPQFQDLRAAIEATTVFLGDSRLTLGSRATTELIRSLVDLAPPETTAWTPELLPLFFTSTDPAGARSEAVLRQLAAQLDTVVNCRRDCAGVLQPDIPADDATAVAAEQVERTLVGLGLLDVLPTRIKTLRQQLLLQADAGRAALQQMKALAGLTTVPFAESTRCLSQLASVFDLATKAPRDLLAYRHSGLQAPGMVARLEAGASEWAALETLKARLKEQLYLDTPVAAAELDGAIVTLREGERWYRVLQPRWHKAIALHRQLDRHKRKLPIAQRLADLEQRRDLGRRQEQWHHDEALRHTLGPFYHSQKPDLSGALRLARWLDLCRDQLTDVGLDPSLIAIAYWDELQLARCAAEVPALASVRAALRTLEGLLAGPLQAAPVVLMALKRQPNWSAQIQLIAESAKALAIALTQLAIWGTPGHSARQILQAVRAHLALPAALAAVAGNAEAQTLLGPHFNGEATIMEPMWAAWTYGQRVHQAALPPAVSQALLAGAASGAWHQLGQDLAAVQRGWDVVSVFAEEMGRYGRFDLPRWVNEPDDRTFPARLVTRTEQARAARETLWPWVQYRQAAHQARERGLTAFVDALEQNAVSPGHLAAVYAYRFYASIAQDIFVMQPTLQRFAGATHDEVRREYRTLDRAVLELRGQECAHRASKARTPPAGQRSTIVGEKTELELIHHMVAHPRSRRTLRQMLSASGQAVQALKPCFLMGPQAVAQFMVPGQLKFDLVVMDEASQLKPEEAIGSIARGQQLVVVGDPKQLPPTSFFDKLSSGSDDDELQQAAITDAESILDVCIGHFRPVRTLRWHYRSRHESLIAFSNHEFYDSRLIVFPSPYGRSTELGLHYQYVPDATYETQLNRVEAARVVDAALEHMQRQPNASLGLVTLNLRQRDLVEEMLEARCRNFPAAQAFRQRWEEENLGLFVKNLEAVQGDERDVIFISTTFGPTPNTQVVRQNFGPIGRQTGWRRLNVLFTRARHSTRVFSSMLPEHIVIDGSTPRGTRALREFLEYARSGVLAVVGPTGQEPDSDFEVAVADVVKHAGYEVVPQLGVAGFRLDMAVKHPRYPGAYLAAVECDGASYHTGVSVRDRDRIRQEILEGLGWKNRIWRIWSTEWFRNPRGETQKLLAFLATLQDQPLPEGLVASSEGDGAPAVPVFDLPPTPGAPGPAMPPACTVTSPATPPTRPATQQLVPEVELVTDDNDLEVEVGDTVTYASAENADDEKTVCITKDLTDLEQGFLAERAPLAQALLGAVVQDEVVLRVPGRPTRRFIIKKKVRRAMAEAT